MARQPSPARGAQRSRREQRNRMLYINARSEYLVLEEAVVRECGTQNYVKSGKNTGDERGSNLLL